jgi:4-carboxymuconolactone decarboxylase
MAHPMAGDDSARRPRRLDPLPGEDWDEAVRSALQSLLPPERANPNDAGNVLSTLVRHRDLTSAYLPFNAYLLVRSTLPARAREVALLRAVHRRDCDYLWSHHLPIAQRAGLTAEEIDAIRCGELVHEADGAVLSAVDDLIDRCTISDTVWTALGRHFTDVQRMDLVFTVGGYCLLAMAVNSFGIQDEQS